MKYFLPLLFLSAFTIAASAQTASKQKPKPNQYAQLLAQLEAGKTDIDYMAFRFAFFGSDKYYNKQHHPDQLEGLKAEMYAAAKAANYKEVIQKGKAVLQIDYTDMAAHKCMQQSYRALGDSANCKKHRAIQFGLLGSITKSGDGKTCGTGWKVIDMSEEFFVLESMGAVMTQQTVDESGGQLCDKVSVTEGGQDKTYYFYIDHLQ